MHSKKRKDIQINEILLQLCNKNVKKLQNTTKVLTIIQTSAKIKLDV